MHLLQTTLKEVCEKNYKDQSKTTITKEVIPMEQDLIQNEKKNIAIPPVPLTYVQLKQDWASLKNDPELLFKYLKV